MIKKEELSCPSFSSVKSFKSYVVGGDEDEDEISVFGKRLARSASGITHENKKQLKK